MCLATVLCSYQFGAIFQQNTARGGFEAYSFGTSEKEIERRAQLYELLEQVPALKKAVPAIVAVSTTKQDPRGELAACKPSTGRVPKRPVFAVPPVVPTPLA